MEKNIKLQTIITMLKSSIGYIIRGYMDDLDTHFSKEEQLKLMCILCIREGITFYTHKMFNLGQFPPKTARKVSWKLTRICDSCIYTKGYSERINKRMQVFLIYLARAGFWNPKNREQCIEKRERLSKPARLIARDYVNYENKKRIKRREEEERKILKLWNTIDI